MRVLIVDDEGVIAFDIANVLEDAGHDVVGIAGSCAAAMAAIARGGIDAAVVDANLNGESAAPIAERLRADGIPFLVASGYAADQLAWLGDARLLAKPFRPEQLLAALAAVTPS